MSDISFDDEEALPDSDEALPEISVAAYGKIDRWRDQLDRTPKIDKRDVFERGAADLFVEAGFERDLASWQAIRDAIYILGRDHAGLDDNSIQFVMDGAQDRTERTNGHARDLPIDDTPAPKDESDYDFGNDTKPGDDQHEQAVAPAVLIRPAQWTNEAPGPIEWLAFQRIPRGDVSTLHGDGGAGKTDIALRLAANCERQSPDWLGHEITPGPVVGISAEEPEEEIKRRLWRHGERDGYDFRSLPGPRLWFPDEKSGAVLAVPDRTGIMRPTALFLSLRAAIKQSGAVLVIVDNVAATYTGNQNDRVMVRSYVNLWRSIARLPSRPAVLLIDHPSLSGLTSGTGRGGNMDWRNAVRCALYLKTPDDKAEADRGIRILETVKSNYGPIGKPTRLQWADGGLQLEHAPSSLHRVAKDQECEEIFLKLLDERNAQGRHVSDKNGKNYAPAIFAEMNGNAGFTAKPFAAAMNRLFEARTIILRPHRRDGKTRDVIDRANACPTQTGSDKQP